MVREGVNSCCRINELKNIFSGLDFFAKCAYNLPVLHAIIMQRIKCPYYEEIRMRYCKAFEKKILVPDCSGKERYCTCEDYLNCPVYAEHVIEKDDTSKKRSKARKQKNE